MAITDEVVASREIFLEGDVAYRRAVSESMLKKHASQNNFVNKYQNDIKEWKLNGSYSVATGITFYDGVASFFYNSEIVGINFYNGKAGTSGTTTFDVKWKNAAGATQGSIFSTLPAISLAASNETIGFKNLVTGTAITPTGVTSPIFNKTTFLEGESLYLELTATMLGAVNCGLTIFYRPI